MSVTVEVYSRVHDEENDLYADYSPVLKNLPVIEFFPPAENEKNFYFQGVIVLNDLEAIRSIINQLGVSVLISASDPSASSDLILTIMDD